MKTMTVEQFSETDLFATWFYKYADSSFWGDDFSSNYVDKSLVELARESGVMLTNLDDHTIDWYKWYRDTEKGLS